MESGTPVTARNWNTVVKLRALMKAMGLLLWLMIPAVVGAQAANAAPNVPIFATTGAFFALSVADLEASARWYSEKLGLTVVMHVPKADKSAVTVLEGGGLIVEWIQHDDAVPLDKAAPTVQDHLFIHGLFKAGVVVEDFDKTLAMLRARGVEIAFGPFPKRPNQRANVIVRDNAGNLIQFFGK
jgi:catechol 2,3-dioxygenase-like lactoylglutathione lyase family enzyme